VSDLGWNGKKNGELMQLFLAASFDAFFTFDRNLQYQQNFKKLPIPVLVLHATDNTYMTLSKLLPEIKKVLNTHLTKGPIIVKQ